MTDLLYKRVRATELEDIVAKVDELIEMAYHCLTYFPKYLILGVNVFRAFEYEVNKTYALMSPTPTEAARPRYRGMVIVISPDADTLELGFGNKDEAERMRQCLHEQLPKGIGNDE